VGSLAVKQIERFLREVDRTFPIPLSQKQDLRELARKFHERASIASVKKNTRTFRRFSYFSFLHICRSSLYTVC
jgi:hypothetical protein